MKLSDRRRIASLREDFGGRFVKIEPLNKGWSGEKKYIAETAGGERLLLRVAGIDKYDEKKREFEVLQSAAEYGAPLPRPVDFGVCGGGKQVYRLLSWIDGEDLGAVLPSRTQAEQYALGLKAGALQRAIHAIPVRPDAESWADWYGRRVREKTDVYFANRHKLAALAPCVDYLVEQKELLRDRPEKFYHGDLNPTNIILTPDGGLAAIDLNLRERNGCDPVWEFCTIPYGAEPNAHFYTGLLRGYYDGEPPRGELAVLMYYFAWEALHGTADFKILRAGMAKDSRRHMENVLRWFDDMRNPVPAWYLSDYK